MDSIAIESALEARRATHLEEEINRHRGHIDRLTHENSEYSSSIAQNLQRMRAARDSLAIAKQASENNTHAAHLVEEWRELVKHARLADYEWEEGTLVLTTTDDLRLHVEDRPDTRWLGAFRIELNLDNLTIELHNLNTRRGGRDHPHVVNGDPCFGGDHAAFSELLANGDLYVLYDQLIQYIETVNLRDEYGAFASYWFDQEDARPIPPGARLVAA